MLEKWKERVIFLRKWSESFGWKLGLKEFGVLGGFVSGAASFSHVQSAQIGAGEEVKGDGKTNPKNQVSAAIKSCS